MNFWVFGSLFINPDHIIVVELSRTTVEGRSFSSITIVGGAEYHFSGADEIKLRSYLQQQLD